MFKWLTDLLGISQKAEPSRPEPVRVAPAPAPAPAAVVTGVAVKADKPKAAPKAAKPKAAPKAKAAPKKSKA